MPTTSGPGEGGRRTGTAVFSVDDGQPANVTVPVSLSVQDGPARVLTQSTSKIRGRGSAQPATGALRPGIPHTSSGKLATRQSSRVLRQRVFLRLA